MRDNAAVVPPDMPPSARPDVIREVNAAIVDAAGKLQPSPTDHWDFYCECDSADCTRVVRLTLAEYAALRDGGEPVLADGHVLAAADRVTSRRSRSQSRSGACPE